MYYRGFCTWDRSALEEPLDLRRKEAEIRKTWLLVEGLGDLQNLRLRRSAYLCFYPVAVDRFAT